MTPSPCRTPSRIYNLSRMTSARVLLTVFYGSEQRLIGQYMPALFEATVSGYLLLTLVSSAMDYSERLRKPGFTQPLALVIDVLVLGLALWVYRANSRAINARAESQAKGLFLARMSHELRTPLHGVIGLADLLRQTHPSPPQPA